MLSAELAVVDLLGRGVAYLVTALVPSLTACLAVHDAHRLAADSRVRMNLLQHLVHVDRVALTSPVLPLLVSATSSLRLARWLFAPFDASFGGIFTSKPYKKLTTK